MKRTIKPLDALIISSVMEYMIITIIVSTFNFVNVNYKYDIKFYIILLTSIYIYLYFIINYRFLWLSIFLVFIFYSPSKVINFLNSFVLKLNYFIMSTMANQYVTNDNISFFITIMIIDSVLFAVLFYFITIKFSSLPFIFFGISIYSFFYYYENSTKTIKQCWEFLIFSVFLLGYTNYLKKKNKNSIKGIKQEKKYFIKWIITIFIFISISFLIAYRLPISNSIRDYSNFSNSSFFRGTSRINHSGQFGFYQTGFQPNPSRLGGPIHLDESIVLKIKTNDDLNSLHLRGCIKDNYNGYIWDSDAKNNTIIDGNKISNYFINSNGQNETIKTFKLISYINSYVIFNPLYIRKINSGGTSFILDTNGEIISNSILKNYDITFKDIDFKQQELINRVYVKPNSSDNSKYLQISSTIPQSVYNLTNEITNKYNNYFLKACAIENYLKVNYPYSLQTSYVPYDRDFVEYFLFDEKKGSCTYFASAMAIMCRIAGIPSRYVEGFAINANDKDDYGQINVKNSDAHAWVELFFNDVGWITFDVTPGFESSYSSIEGNEKNTGDNTQNQNDLPKETQPKPQNNIEKDKEVKKVDKENTNSNFLKYFLYGASFLVLCGVALKIKYSSNKKLLKYSNAIMKYGKYSGCVYKKDQTFREYCNSIKDKLNINLDYSIEVYEKYTYGKEKISNQDKLNIKSEIKQLRKYAYSGKKVFYNLIRNVFDNLIVIPIYSIKYIITNRNKM